ncbi:hypothetical protein ACUJ8H_18625 [Streptomyces sp. EKR5.2]|uniref:hypothetical protein n=1 Tax=Streptomyces sp. EKR5.2 TaxID=3461014 RepID=UPI004042839E
MPRRRPGHIRAALPRRPRNGDTKAVVDGLSQRALSEITRLEHTWNHLQPGDVTRAVRVWGAYVKLPVRRLWLDHESGDVHWYCCEDPLEARALLEIVLHAVSPRSARELRVVVGRYDAMWNTRAPSLPADGR